MWQQLRPELNSILGSVDDLNTILEANGEGLRVSVDNLELVFLQIGPIAAINDVLAFVGKTPTEADLIERVSGESCFHNGSTPTSSATCAQVPTTSVLSAKPGFDLQRSAIVDRAYCCAPHQG